MKVQQGHAILLVSDQCWQDVLSLVPIAIRPKDERWLPVLIYHQEGDTIDMDAPLHFLRNYRPLKDEGEHSVFVVLIGALSPHVKNTLFNLLNSECGIASERIRQIHSVSQLQTYLGVKTGVIVARNDYATGLIAAPFAALQGAHLCFLDGENLDEYKPLVSKLDTVHLVGQLDEGVTSYLYGLEGKQIEPMTTEDIQREYKEQTKTTKIVLVNPYDLDIDLHHEESHSGLPEYGSSRGPGMIRYLFGNTSLVAPFLAAAKQEFIVLVSRRHPCPKEVDDTLKQAMSDLGQESGYLTIVASPEAIPMAAFDVGPPYMVELDSRVYGSNGNSNDDLYQWAVGRIFGITVSDCSAYVARVLFFDKLDRPQEPQALSVLIIINPVTYDDGKPKILIFEVDDQAEEPEDDYAKLLENYSEEHYWNDEIRELFDHEYVCVENEIILDDQVETVEKKYPNASLIVYAGHGNYNGFGLAMNTSKLTSGRTYLAGFPVILGIACETGAYERIKHKRLEMAEILANEQVPNLATLFVAQNIRRGAMAQQCAVGKAYWHNELNSLLKALYGEGCSIGDALRKAKRIELDTFKAKARDGGIDNFSEIVDGDPHYVLVGDPTFEPRRYMS